MSAITISVPGGQRAVVWTVIVGSVFVLLSLFVAATSSSGQTISVFVSAVIFVPLSYVPFRSWSRVHHEMQTKPGLYDRQGILNVDWRGCVTVDESS